LIIQANDTNKYHLYAKRNR